LSDNLSLVSAVVKGWARDYPLLAFCRTLAGVSLAANIRFSTRWLASEINVLTKADGASRHFQPAAQLDDARYRDGRWWSPAAES
jgi:hypothetical protein